MGAVPLVNVRCEPVSCAFSTRCSRRWTHLAKTWCAEAEGEMRCGIKKDGSKAGVELASGALVVSQGIVGYAEVARGKRLV